MDRVNTGEGDIRGKAAGKGRKLQHTGASDDNEQQAGASGDKRDKLS